MSDIDLASKIKIILLTGFLGVGKTTLLSSILNDKVCKDKKIAVLVNDFGALPVDAALLPDGDYYVSKINKGSIFCLCTSVDIIKALEVIANDINPDYLLIEATGMAEPSSISAMLRTDILKKRYSEGVAVCMVDAINCPKLITILPAISSQISIADLIIINKIDLVARVDIDKLVVDLKNINRDADIVETEYANVEYSKIFDKIHSMVPCERDSVSSNLKLKAPEGLIDYDLQSNVDVSRIKFYDLLNKHRNEIVRAKGIVSFSEDKKFIDIVNGALKIRQADFAISENVYRAEVTFILRESANSEQFMIDIKKLFGI